MQRAGAIDVQLEQKVCIGLRLCNLQGSAVFPSCLHADAGKPLSLRMSCMTRVYWVAVKELKLSYLIGETLLFTMYIPIMVTYFKFLKSNPVGFRIQGVLPAPGDPFAATVGAKKIQQSLQGVS